ncbi:MAG: phage baseplate assembly protein V [Desulfobacterales bacterium]|nr:phage baseplate assembly protein V [Desulfobacterales bacterium]
MEDLRQRIKTLETSVNQMFRQGIVNSVQADKGTVRVQLPDADNVITRELTVLFPRTFKNKVYDMPEVGEQVACFFLPNGMEQGFVLGAVYSAADTVPITDPDKTHVTFKDGTMVEYDRKAHALTLNINGRADIYADDEITIESGTHIQLTAPRIDLN